MLSFMYRFIFHYLPFILSSTLTSFTFHITLILIQSILRCQKILTVLLMGSIWLFLCVPVSPIAELTSLLPPSYLFLCLMLRSDLEFGHLFWPDFKHSVVSFLAPGDLLFLLNLIDFFLSSTSDLGISLVHSCDCIVCWNGVIKLHSLWGLTGVRADFSLCSFPL